MSFGDGKYIDHGAVHAQAYVPPRVVVLEEPHVAPLLPSPLEDRPRGVPFRRASAVTNTAFPYADPTVTFITIEGKEREFLLQHQSIDSKRVALEDATSDTVVLAVWPGRTRSDVFWVDDLNTALEAVRNVSAGFS